LLTEGETMITAPKVQVLYRRTNDILFGWHSVDKKDAISFNLYACSTPNGIYSLIKSNIQNNIDKNYKKVIVYIKDTDIPIPTPLLTRYYFKLTYIDTLNVESNLLLSQVTTIYPPDVDYHFENEQQEANNHNFAWVEENQRWEKLLLTQDGKLKVDAVVNIGDITISDVKIATLPDDITKKYILVDNQRRTVVSQDPNVFLRFEKFEEHSIINKNVETIILTYSNIQQYFINKICCSGTADALFKLKINGNIIQVLRNSWNNRNIIFDFCDKSLSLLANSTITITCTHYEELIQNYEVSLYGFSYTY
jgi:hypothetical protein